MDRSAKRAALPIAVLALTVPSFGQSSSKQNSGVQSNSESASGKKTPKVWTNDDIGKASGRISVVGEGARQSRRHAQAASGGDLSIVSPAAGTVIRPGQVITVDVRVPPEKAISRMAILTPIGQSATMRESPPWSFTLTVTTDEMGMSGPLMGEHLITAMAVDAQHPGETLQGFTTVDVEEPDKPLDLWTQWHELSFRSPTGVPLGLIVVGVFPDGLQLDLRESTRIAFASSDIRVAKVDEQGLVTPVGPGNATITVSYEGAPALSVKVPVSVPPRSIE